MKNTYIYPGTISMNISNVTLPPSVKIGETFPEIPLGDFIGISVAVFAGIGVIANFLILVVLSISQRTRYSSYRYLISHLAISDLLCSIFLLVYVPLELESHNWIYSKHACKIVYPAITFFTNLSVGTILIISVERYRGVILPLMSSWKQKDVWIALGLVWLIGTILVIPNVIVIKVTKYENIEYCNEAWNNQTLRKLYGFSFFVLAFLIPLLALIFMHTSIMVRIKRPDLRPANISRHQIKTNARIMRVLTAMVIGFFVCVAPNKLLYFVWDISPALEKSTTTKVRFYLRTIQVLFYSRVAVNPLLYCFFDTRFKKDFKNTRKSIRGLSFVDSDISRGRSRTFSHPVPPLVLRSRASSCLSQDGNHLDCNAHFIQSDIISKLASVPEIANEKPFSNGVSRIVMDVRLRSDSCNSVLCGSSSPLVNSAYMFDSQEVLKNENIISHAKPNEVPSRLH